MPIYRVFWQGTPAGPFLPGLRNAMSMHWARAGQGYCQQWRKGGGGGTLLRLISRLAVPCHWQLARVVRERMPLPSQPAMCWPNRGNASGATRGAGGLAGSCVGDTTYSGGDGAPGNSRLRVVVVLRDRQAQARPGWFGLQQCRRRRGRFNGGSSTGGQAATRVGAGGAGGAGNGGMERRCGRFIGCWLCRVKRRWWRRHRRQQRQWRRRWQPDYLHRHQRWAAQQRTSRGPGGGGGGGDTGGAGGYGGGGGGGKTAGRHRRRWLDCC